MLSETVQPASSGLEHASRGGMKPFAEVVALCVSALSANAESTTRCLRVRMPRAIDSPGS